MGDHLNMDTGMYMDMISYKKAPGGEEELCLLKKTAMAHSISGHTLQSMQLNRVNGYLHDSWYQQTEYLKLSNYIVRCSL